MLEFEGVEKCKGAPLLEGLPSQGGLTSVIAANYLADQVPTPPPLRASESERAWHSSMRVYQRHLDI